jgi:ribosome maturation factor RimP
MAVGQTQTVKQSSLWSVIHAVALEEGVELFDIDMPGEGGESEGRGLLRVYITRDRSKDAQSVEPAAPISEDGTVLRAEVLRTGVLFEECVRVSKRLLDIDESDGLIPDNCLLEVSSPGVNRRLRRVEHFQGAIGERVRVKFRGENNSGDKTSQTVTGLLRSVIGETLEIDGEEKSGAVSVSLCDVKEARIDFKFE